MVGGNAGWQTLRGVKQQKEQPHVQGAKHGGLPPPRARPELDTGTMGPLARLPRPKQTTTIGSTALSNRLFYSNQIASAKPGAVQSATTSAGMEAKGGSGWVGMADSTQVQVSASAQA